MIDYPTKARELGAGIDDVKRLCPEGSRAVPGPHRVQMYFDILGEELEELANGVVERRMAEEKERPRTLDVGEYDPPDQRFDHIGDVMHHTALLLGEMGCDLIIGDRCIALLRSLERRAHRVRDALQMEDLKNFVERDRAVTAQNPLHH